MSVLYTLLLICLFLVNSAIWNDKLSASSELCICKICKNLAFVWCTCAMRVRFCSVSCMNNVMKWPESEQEQSCWLKAQRSGSSQACWHKQGATLSRDPAGAGPVTLSVRERREGFCAAALGRCTPSPRPWKITEHSLRAKQMLLYMEAVYKVVCLL